MTGRRQIGQVLVLVALVGFERFARSPFPAGTLRHVHDR